MATGAAGLIYEVVWFKFLGTIFGVTTLATSTVLAVFMGGLAIGAAIAARVGDRWERPLFAYGVLETVLGVLAALVPVLLPPANRVFVFFYDALDPSLLVLSILRAVMSALVLLPPATLMGMTLPVLSRAFSRDTAAGRDVGFLYTINTLGAVAGAALAGFWLLPSLGLTTSSFVGVALNLVVGIVALALGRGLRIPVRTEEAPEPSGAKDGWARPELVAIAAISGFASLGLQVYWTRALLLSLGNTVYAFTVILVTVLVGITAGSGVATALLSRIRRPAIALALSQVLGALAIIALTPLFDDLPARFLAFSERWGGSWTGFLTVVFAVAALAMLPATLLLGMGLPLVIGTAVRGGRDLARGVGTLYSVNTWGGIAGAILAGFVLLPALGIRQGILVSAGLGGVSAVLALGLVRMPGLARTVTAIGFLGVVGGSALSVPEWSEQALTRGVYTASRDGEEGNESERLVFYEEGIAATVSVKRRGSDLKLQLNGRTEATSRGDLKTNMMIGSLPMVLHPDPRDVLVIGLASGVTLAATAWHPAESLECVELSRGIVEAARLFSAFNDSVLDDPRVKILEADGRNHLLLTRKSYDVIVSQPSNLWAAGVGNLFTREFFELCSDHLTDDGILCQWIQGYSVSSEAFRSLLHTVSESFPSVDVWVAEWSDVIVIARKEPVPMDLERIRDCFADARIGAGLRRGRVHDEWILLSHHMLDSEAVRLFSEGARLHTDDNRLVEFLEPKHIADGETAPQSQNLVAWQVDVRPELTGYPPEGVSREEADEGLERARAARRREIEARVLEDARRGSDAVEAFRQAVAANPADRAIRRNLATLHVRMGVQAAQRQDYRIAWENFSAAVTADSTSAPAFANLGFLALASNQVSEALVASRRAVELDPLNENYLRQLGDAHALARDFDYAVREYERALAIRPEDEQTLLRLEEARRKQAGKNK